MSSNESKLLSAAYEIVKMFVRMYFNNFLYLDLNCKMGFNHDFVCEKSRNLNNLSKH